MAIKEAAKPIKAQKKFNSRKKLGRTTTLMAPVKTLKPIY